MLDLNRSHLSTKSFGTIPYMPPELLADGHMSRKSDVSVPLPRRGIHLGLFG